MTDKQLLEQALEALESCMYPQQKQIQTITAIKQALAAPVQEPVAYRTWVDGWQYTETPGGGEALCLCTPPTAQRQWVGLTDEEMHECWDSPLTPLGMKHARMIEAKLKEKNT